ncbi:YeeE/YedE family protein [Alphaproteobacteria bacterium]|nr:YeeE/YedE family protein [Alphaproteobacteria bacterium]
MTVAWASFTPISAFLGGCLIGLAALLLMVFQGRIMGVSGIIGGLFGTASPAERGWRLAFLLGAVAGPIIWQAVTKAPIIWQAVAKAPIIWQAVASGPQFYIAAFLVGLGTAIGSGCTSGHGICGLARFSPRSLIAVMTFMTSAVATVAIVNHI